MTAPSPKLPIERPFNNFKIIIARFLGIIGILWILNLYDFSLSNINNPDIENGMFFNAMVLIASSALIIYAPKVIKKYYPFAKYKIKSDKIMGWEYAMAGMKTGHTKKTIPLSKETDKIIIKKGSQYSSNTNSLDIFLRTKDSLSGFGNEAKIETLHNLNDAIEYCDNLIPQLNVQQTIYVHLKLQNKLDQFRNSQDAEKYKLPTKIDF